MGLAVGIETNAWLGLLFARGAPSSNSHNTFRKVETARSALISFEPSPQTKDAAICVLRLSLLPSQISMSIDPNTNDYVPGGK